MKKRLQNGFAHLGLLLLLAIVVVIGLIGYKVWSNQNNKVSNSSVSVATQQQTIKTKADLDKVESTLNNANLDSDLNPDSLNQDVQSLRNCVAHSLYVHIQLIALLVSSLYCIQMRASGEDFR
jgi:uncharacterized protein HemX